MIACAHRTAAAGPSNVANTPSPGRDDLATALMCDRSFHDAVVFAQPPTPRGVAESSELLRRSDNICEEHRCETSIVAPYRAGPFRDEALDFGQQGLDVPEPRDPVVAFELDEPRAADLGGDIAASFDLLDLVTRAMQHECRGLNDRQHLPDVRVL